MPELCLAVFQCKRVIEGPFSERNVPELCLAVLQCKRVIEDPFSERTVPEQWLAVIQCKRVTRDPYSERSIVSYPASCQMEEGREVEFCGPLELVLR